MFLDNLLNPDKPGIAVDVGSRFVKTVALKKIGNKIQVVNYAIEAFEDSVEDKITASAQNETIPEEFKEKVITSLTSVIKNGGGKGKNVISAINSRFLVTRIISIMGDETSPEFTNGLQAAYKEQFANYKENTIRKSHAIIIKGSGEVPNKVIVSAAKIESVDFLNEIFTRAGYKITKLDGIPFALFNLFKYRMDNDEEIANLEISKKNFILIDIGFNNMNVVGIKEGNLASIKSSFNFNDRFIIEGLMSNEGLDFKKAYETKFELFKQSVTDEKKEKIRKEILDKYYKNYFGNQLNMIITQIDEAIEEMDIDRTNLNKIVLSGGGSYFPFILDFISTKIKRNEDLNLKVELLNPFYGMSMKPGNVDIYKNSLYAVAAGLALRTL